MTDVEKSNVVEVIDPLSHRTMAFTTRFLIRDIQ